MKVHKGFEIQVVCWRVRNAACSDGEPDDDGHNSHTRDPIFTHHHGGPRRGACPQAAAGQNRRDEHRSSLFWNYRQFLHRDSEDGRFHLETRLQQLPRQQAVLHIYEATLDAFQLSRLESMLDAQAVREASTYKGPKLPVVVPTIANVRIEIARADRVQTVGYFAWNQQTGTDGLSPESTPEALKEEWRSSRLALTPLLGWFHEVEGMKWPELAESHSTLCGDPSTEG
jgi:hypothetical protein